MQTKKFQYWKLFVVFIVIYSFLSTGSSQAKSNTPPVQSRRPAQELRQLVLQGSFPERYRPGSARRAADAQQPGGQILSPVWSDIVFQSYRDNSWNLYLYRGDGSGEPRYGGIEGSSLYPAFQKNGQSIAFVNTVTGNQEIYRMGRDGSGLRRLTDSPATDTLPAWSPDGSLIAFQSNRAGSTDIYVMDGNGGGLTVLANSPAYDGEPSWSPDGKQIVFVSNRAGSYDLWVMNADGSNQHQITRDAAAMGPVWSPQGDLIAYANDGDRNDFYELWLVDPEGSNAKNLYFTQGYGTIDVWAPAWSPDGKALTLIVTYWIEYQGYWYWTDSYLYWFTLNRSVGSLSSDNTIWHADWAVNDPAPPGPCSVTPANQRGWSDLPVRFSAMDQGLSGVVAYDGQVRKPEGAWQELVSWIRSNGAVYSGLELGQVEFRCRAYDMAGNAGEWSATPVASPVVDALPPISSIWAPSSFVRGNAVNLSWSGTDQGSGIASYDIFYKDGPSGKWTVWLSHTTASQATFTGEGGHTYYFRSQAYDQEGHTQPWQAAPQAEVTFYSAALDLAVTGPRGVSVPFSFISLQPSPVLTQTGTAPGVYRYLLGGDPLLSLGVESAGFGSLPASTLSTAQDASFTWVLPPVEDLVVDGGFEQDGLPAWSVTTTGAGRTGAAWHTGAAALELSQAGPGTSSASQDVTLPGDLSQPTLSWLYYIPADLAEGAFEVEVTGETTSTILLSTSAAGEWKHAWADLSAFAGQQVSLVLRLTGAPGTVLVDEVSLGEWRTPRPLQVRPSQLTWNQAITLTIDGENFLPTPQVYLDDLLLTNVTWVSARKITAQAPAGIQTGLKDLLVVNPGGASGALPAAVQVAAWQSYLPLVNKNSQGSSLPARSDWTMLGYDSTRSGYNKSEAGASLYSKEWEITPTTNLCYDADPLVVADGVLVSSVPCQRQAFGLDAQTGTQLWNYTLQGYGGSVDPVIANGRVYYGESTYSQVTMHALDLYSGVEYWSNVLPSTFDPLVAEHRALAFGQYGLVALNASSGASDVNKNNGLETSATRLAYQGGLVYQLHRGILNAINPRTGGALWSMGLVQVVGSVNDPGPGPVISGRTAVVTFEGYPSQIFAINLDTRQIMWYSQGENNHSFTPYAAAADGVVYITGGTLRAFDLSNGELLWSFAPEDHETFNEYFLESPIITQKYIYVSSYCSVTSKQKTYVIDRLTHQVVWKVNQGGWLAVANGFLYISSYGSGGYDHKITAYRAQVP